MTMSLGDILHSITREQVMIPRDTHGHQSATMLTYGIQQDHDARVDDVGDVEGGITLHTRVCDQCLSAVFKSLTIIYTTIHIDEQMRQIEQFFIKQLASLPYKRLKNNHRGGRKK